MDKIIIGGFVFTPYVDIPSTVIVFGGTIAVTFALFEASDINRIIGSTIPRDTWAISVVKE